MKISIIIAGYNREKFLKASVESVLEQSYKNWELILIDDGSTDKTSQIMKEYASKFENIIFYQKTHSGCWSTKNLGINLAKSDFLFFLDSDDFLDKDYLKTGVAYISKFPNYDYYYPPELKVTDELGVPKDFIWRYLDYNEKNKWQIYYYFFLKGNGGIPHVGSFIRKTIFDKFGLYDENLVNLADLKYILNYGLKIKMKMIPNWSGYYNRQHSNQINKSPERLETIANLMYYVVKNYPPNFFLADLENLSEKDKKEKVYKKLISNFIENSKQSSEKNHIFLKYAKILLKEIRTWK